MSIIEKNPFASQSTASKKPQEEMVGAILGEEGRREFEKKWGKEKREPAEQVRSATGLHEEEEKMLEVLELEKASRKYFREAEQEAEAGKKGFSKREALRVFAVELARAGRDPEKAFKKVEENLRDSDDTNYFDYLLFADALVDAGLDPTATLLRAKEMALTILPTTVQQVRDQLIGLTSHALMRAGLLDEAAPLIQQISDDAKRLHQLIFFGKMQAQQGKDSMESFRKAKEIAMKLTEYKDRLKAISTLAEELAKVGRFAEAKEAAEKINEPLDRSVILSRMAGHVAKQGEDPSTYFTQADKYAKLIFESTARATAFAVLAAEQKKAGNDPTEAMQAANDACSQSVRAPSILVTEYARAGLLDDAKKYAKSVYYHPGSPEAFSTLSKEEAKAGRFASANDFLAMLKNIGVDEYIDAQRFVIQEMIHAELFLEARQLAEKERKSLERSDLLDDIAIGLAEAGQNPAEVFSSVEAILASTACRDMPPASRSVYISHLAGSLAVAAKAMRARLKK